YDLVTGVQTCALPICQCPGHAGVWNEQNKWHHRSAQPKCDFAGLSCGELSAHQIAGEAASEKATDARSGVGNPGESPHRLDVERSEERRVGNGYRGQA